MFLFGVCAKSGKKALLNLDKAWMIGISVDPGEIDISFSRKNSITLKTEGLQIIFDGESERLHKAMMEIVAECVGDPEAKARMEARKEKMKSLEALLSKLSN